jgi:uncharacterized membrane protein YtjA (UPF0391 family)
MDSGERQISPVRKANACSRHEACTTWALIEQAVDTAEGEKSMIRYAVIFLVVALVAALLGFGALAGLAADISKILFLVFLAMAVISFLVNLIGGGRGGTTIP